MCVRWVIGHLFLFLLSKISISTLENIIFLFLFLLSKLKIRISNFSFYSRNSRSESQISPSTLEIRDQNLKFLFLLSKFEIRILNISFYSRIYFFDSRQCLLVTYIMSGLLMMLLIFTFFIVVWFKTIFCIRFKSAKYTLLTFLPLNIIEQFRRGANFYFLVSWT